MANGITDPDQQLTERLEATEGRLRTVLSHAPLVLFAIDVQGRITSLEGRSSETRRLGLGDDGHALIGSSLFERCAHVPALVQACRMALAGQEHTAGFTLDGRAHYEARYEPVRDEGGRVTGVIGVALDVTELRETEAALLHSEAMLGEASRMAALGSLAGGVAHQINNALTSARLSLNRLVSFELSRRPVTPARLHRIELLQDAREGIARVERITKELKSFARTECEPTGPVDVRDVLDAVIRVSGHELRHRAVVVCEYRDVPLAHGSEVGLRQVFLHLLMNAAQSIPEGEAHLNEIRITTRTSAEGDVVIEVKDTGDGIPPDEVDQIFEPFFTTRPAGHALGLGLSICRDTITELGGEITADSEIGEGTTMRVVLPAGDRRSLSSARGRKGAAPMPGSGRGRILIIDDDRPVAAAVALELEEHDVVVAGSGREGLEILHRDQGFDAIVCDVMMPEVSGIDLYQQIALHSPALARRFVFMTGGAFTTRAQRFLADVPNPRLEKPFAAEELRAVVRTLIPPADAPPPGPRAGGDSGQKVKRTPKRAENGE